MTENDTGSNDTEATGEDEQELPEIEWYVRRAAVIVLAIAAFFVAVAFYNSVNNAIDVWIGDRFVDIFRAVFNLAVLLVLGYGLLYELEAVRDEE